MVIICQIKQLITPLLFIGDHIIPLLKTKSFLASQFRSIVHAQSVVQTSMGQPVCVHRFVDDICIFGLPLHFIITCDPFYLLLLHCNSLDSEFHSFYDEMYELCIDIWWYVLRKFKKNWSALFAEKKCLLGAPRKILITIFPSFLGKKVDGNNVGAVHVIVKRKYRQYMNRKGGFNRPLDYVA